MPKFTISEYLPSRLVHFIFKSIYKKPEQLSPEFRKELTHKYYKEEIPKLEKLIGRDLSKWLI